jgi:hypothetical protein
LRLLEVEEPHPEVFLVRSVSTSDARRPTGALHRVSNEANDLVLPPQRSPMKRHRTYALFATLALLAIPAARAEAQQLPQTWQEQQNFRSGPTPFEPLMEFWYRLDEMSPIVTMQPLTHTLLDREMQLITIADAVGPRR